jgi:hypothetical protein
MDAITSDTTPRRHCAVENHVVVETFRARKEARIFKDSWEDFHNTRIKILTTDRQLEVGDRV